jgi:hypothetical protein
MSTNPGPAFEELLFIYDLISKGADDSLILAEYNRLKDENELKFPLRTEIDFIKDRRKEFSAAESVIKGNFYTQPAPVSDNNKSGHFEHLMEIISVLLEDIPLEADPDKARDSNLLTNELEENLFNAGVIYGEWEVNYDLIDHLQTENPDFQNIKSFINKNPSEYIRSLRTIARRGTFMGSCRGCNS